MHIEASETHFALIEGNRMIHFAHIGDGYQVSIDEFRQMDITVHQMHVLADWLRERVERELVK